MTRSFDSKLQKCAALAQKAWRRRLPLGMSVVAMLRKASSEWKRQALKILAMSRLRRAGSKIAREGPINAARAALRIVFTHRRPIGTEFDEHYGTDTAGNDPLWRYRITSNNAVFGSSYVPTDEGDFRRALSSPDCITAGTPCKSDMAVRGLMRAASIRAFSTGDSPKPTGCK